MILQYASISGHSLIIGQQAESRIDLPTGSSGVDYVQVSFTGTTWNDFTVRELQFWMTSDAVYPSEIDSNGLCAIPAAVLNFPAVIHMAAKGEDDSEPKKVISTNEVTFTVNRGAFTSANAPAPSPSLFEQAVGEAVSLANAAADSANTAASSANTAASAANSAANSALSAAALANAKAELAQSAASLANTKAGLADAAASSANAAASSANSAASAANSAALTANTAANSANTAVSNANASVGKPFSDQDDYNKGDYVQYNGLLYVFTVDRRAGAWDDDDVERAYLTDAIADAASEAASAQEAASLANTKAALANTAASSASSAASAANTAAEAALAAAATAAGDMPAGTIKGNAQGSAASPANLTKSQVLGMFPMTGASVNQRGAAGFTPEPASGDNVKFLRGDGTWAVPSGTRLGSERDFLDISANTAVDLNSLYAKLGRWYQEIDKKANTDGYYENLGAGTAEQLVSSVSEEDFTPYLFRTSGGSIDIGDREEDMLVGGTLSWNQLINGAQITSATAAGVLFTNDNGVVDIDGTASANAYKFIALVSALKDHKLLVSIGQTAITGVAMYDDSPVAQFMLEPTETVINASGIDINMKLRVDSGTTLSHAKVHPQIFDLTQMLGSAVADYIYSLETANAGAGTGWFRKLFPKSLYSYNAGALMSVNASAHRMTGFNAYDNTTGKARLVGGREYQITGTYTSLSYETVSGNSETITPDADGMFTPVKDGTLTVTGGNAADTCVHLVWDGERNGEYEAYVLHSYPLDSSVTLRGVLKLDANNRLYYDGDTYESDGTVTRKYAEASFTQDDVTEAPFNSGYSNIAYAQIPKPADSAFYNSFSLYGLNATKFTVGGGSGGSWDSSAHIGGLFHSAAQNHFWIGFAHGTALSEMKAAINGLKIVYELASPTSQAADPYTDPQIVSDWGTEEYVDCAYTLGAREVAVPVGHETKYQANLRAKLEMAPDSPGGNGDYIVRQSGGVNSYVEYTDSGRITTLETRVPAPPTSDGTYRLTVTVTDGAPVFTWESA